MNSLNIQDVIPCGPYITVEIVPVEEKTKGGIIMSTANELKREQVGRDVGRVVALGPIAYQGFADCKNSEDWGYKIGDYVEFERYDGKKTRAAEFNPKFENIRILVDGDIVARWRVADE